MPTLALLVLLAMSAGCASPDPATRAEALLAEYARPGAPGASVLILKEGRILYRKAFGLANLEDAEPATPATNYRLASVTKQFTAMAILLLVDEGRLSLDDRLSDLLPGFPLYAGDVSIHHLLTHRSGLIDYEDIIPPETAVPLKDADVVRLLQDQDSTYFAPGTAFRYSNSGYAVLAEIVAAVSGRSFAAFLHDRIFLPLGMTGTVAFEEGISTVPHRAFGYAEREGAFVRHDQSLTSAVLGDGGVYASIDDLAAWYRALDDGRLVRPGLMEQVFVPAENTQHEGAGYGFGWFVGQYGERASVWHTGSTVGFRNAVERFPRARMTVVVLSNREAEVHGLARALADVFFDEGL